jgi:hypothetical protein
MATTNLCPAQQLRCRLYDVESDYSLLFGLSISNDDMDYGKKVFPTVCTKSPDSMW